MSVPVWIALGVVVVALGVLGVLAFEVFGHLRRLRRTVRLVEATLVPKLVRLEPLAHVEVPRLRPGKDRGEVTGGTQPQLALPSGSPGVGSGSRRQEETS